jgi:non-heme chloroperoxidase
VSVDARRRRIALAAPALTLPLHTRAAPASSAPMPAAPGNADAPAAPLARSTLRTSDGVRLSLLSAGTDARATPLLFVPGWCMPADLWTPHLLHAARSRPAWALDPRGQGESDIAASGYDADRRAADLFEALAQFKRPVIVVAWSLAGVELLHGLPRHGARRLAGVVLVDSTLGEGPAGSGAGVAAFRQRLRDDRDAMLDEFARAIFRQPQTDERIAALVAAMRRVPLDASLQMLDWGLKRERLRAAARALRVPLLLAITPQYREQARLHRAARAATEVELFEDAGHALFADAPQRFDALIERFAQRVEREKAAEKKPRAKTPKDAPSAGRA